MVRESTRTSEPGYSIKNMEAFYMDKRVNAVATAADSIIVYNEWCETGADELLQEISDYNEVDCFSTHLLHDWLLTLKPEDAPWFKGPPEEELQCNIEFLYSKNRLNVAVSRAQFLAVVVANPKLLEIPCGTVERMKLVNTFCWLDEYAKTPAEPYCWPRQYGYSIGMR